MIADVPIKPLLTEDNGQALELLGLGSYLGLSSQGKNGFDMDFFRSIAFLWSILLLQRAVFAHILPMHIFSIICRYDSDSYVEPGYSFPP